MAQLIGKNEAVEYVRSMPNQRHSEGMEFPTNTNMRGGARPGGHRGENDIKEHHAEGDMVGRRTPMPHELISPRPQPMAMKCGGMMKKGGMMHKRHEKRDY